ncbi:hypothetical protein CYLTODRAFT_373966 [Cylindrobasidium torrendii FP15055 ss-10]|uniref:Uncharacterized protein n=1 Tax=Cylindrobasidium torrendii FP15055 ss-10 TaxID=1314674 RepID=A0A0D7BF48_9AGAR|nr:hypothetical protein CYLTODRAFT_373966 [Cylindrobasidium torrendii FP15055 ss-10]
MNSVRNSPENFPLHRAALVGDYDAFKRVVEEGADVNELDQAGRTAIMCAVAGQRWDDISAAHESAFTSARLNIIRALVSRPDVTLYTLNAPQEAFRGVTPIGMAAWLNLYDAVNALLEGSLQSVSVDGMDTHGATSLMYAARDQNIRVVQLLLQNGARPDFRDRNYRTSIQFALPHPPVLHLCEEILRQHRWRETKATVRGSTAASAFDYPADFDFGGEISVPSIPIASVSKATKALIRAVVSSDVATLHSLLSPLFLSSHTQDFQCLVNAPDLKGWSPIHYCASGRTPCVQALKQLYYAGADVSLFTAKEHFTPLHCLARSGYLFLDEERISLLSDFLIGLVRDYRAPLAARDKEDETCIHIAAEHGQCLNVLVLLLELDTTGQVRELRNARGLTALEVAKPEFRLAFGQDERPSSSCSIYTLRPATSYSSMVSFFDLPDAPQGLEASAPSFDSTGMGQRLVTNLRLTSPAIHHDQNTSYFSHLEGVLGEAEEISLELIAHFRARTEDTSKELLELSATARGITNLFETVSRDADAVTEERGIESINPWRSKRGSEDSQKTMVSTGSATPPSPTSPGFAVKSEEKATSKWKSWFKRKPSADRLNIPASPSPSPTVGQTPAPSPIPPVSCFWSSPSIDNALRTSQVVLTKARRDLLRIDERIAAGQGLILKANQAISRTERIIQKAIRKRKVLVSDLRQTYSNRRLGSRASPGPGSPNSLGYSQFVSSKLFSRNSMTSLFSNSSANSNSTVLESDDDETRVVRRLVLRKIDAHISAAQEEIDLVIQWLRIVKEVVRGVRRRAYLY